MVVEENLQQLLQALQPLYKEIQQRRSRLRDLETVPLARDMYEQALAQENERVSLLRQRRQILEEELSTLISAQRLNKVAHPEHPLFSIRQQRTPFSMWNAPQMPSTTLADRKEQAMPTLDRTQVQKLINRWKFFWKIDPTIIGQFNRIVFNVDRPIGEALALLDWSLYQECIYPGESLVARLERLKQWYAALTEYDTWLKAEIYTQEARFQNLLQVWEIWRQRDQPQGSERWLAFLERTRQAKQEEIEHITQEINETSQEIIRIKEEEKSGHE